MIIFPTEDYKEYNAIIHNFMEIEIFNGDTDIGDIVEDIFPKYLYREQYLKCAKTLKELFAWTEDKFYHDMRAFHELALYQFIEHMKEKQDETPEFLKIYFNSDLKNQIEENCKQKHEYDNEYSIDEYREWFYDIQFYEDTLFVDLDFLYLDILYNNRRFDNTFIEEYLGINIDYYFELLPLDI